MTSPGCSASRDCGRWVCRSTRSPTDWADVLRSVQLLNDLGSGAAAVRQRAALASSTEGLAPQTIATAVLTERDPSVRGALMWSLTADDRTLDVLAAGLASDDVEVRRRAVSAVVELPGAASTEVLRRGIDDTDDVVRARAALELGRRGDTGITRTLIAMIVDGVSDVDAAEVLSILAADRAVAESIVNELQRLLDGSESGARSRVAQALMELPTPADDILARFVDDKDPAVAALATAATLRRAHAAHRRRGGSAGARKT